MICKFYDLKKRKTDKKRNPHQLSLWICIHLHYINSPEANHVRGMTQAHWRIPRAAVSAIPHTREVIPISNKYDTKQEAVWGERIAAASTAV